MQVPEVACLRAVRAPDQIVSDFRQYAAPWLPVFLQARSDVDPVAIDVVRRCHYLADVNRNTQSNRICFCNLLSVDGVLDFARPVDRVQRTRKLCENTVTGGLDDPPRCLSAPRRMTFAR